MGDGGRPDPGVVGRGHRPALVADDRAPGGFELKVTALETVQIAPEYPIGKKDHGPDFLLNHRHLWLRSRRQHAIMRVRSERQPGDPRLLLHAAATP